MIGSTVHRFEIVTSTNDIARDLAIEGAAEGTAVVAAEQSKGRGSRGRSWVSPPNSNLLLSVVLRPQISPDRLGELAFIAAIAVAETIREQYKLDATIKWPNDVQINGKKISGIIVEAMKGAAILGIGINVNFTELPEEIAATATSIAIEKGIQVDIDDVLKHLLAELDIYYNVYRARGFAWILDKWMQYQTTIGKDVTVGLSEGCVEGKAVAVDDTGSLIVELPSGERRSIPAATVVTH